MSYEVGSGRAVDRPVASLDDADAERQLRAAGRWKSDNDALRMLDAARYMLTASYRDGDTCDGAAIQCVLDILAQIERRLVAGR